MHPVSKADSLKTASSNKEMWATCGSPVASKLQTFHTYSLELKRISLTIADSHHGLQGYEKM